ncbi:MAG: ELWxxDGT repeat protein [Planctomycetaceae bacterium]
MRISSILELLTSGKKSRSRRKPTNRLPSAVAAEILEHRQLLTAQVTQIGDLNLGVEDGSSDPQQLTQMGTTLYFVAGDKTHGRELWKKEGANAAVLVKDIRPGIESSGVNYLTVVGNTLFFQADDGPRGPELWKSDGSAAGTVCVKDIVDPGNPNTTNLALGPKELHNVNGKLFFQAYPEFGNPNPTLMVSDGTAAGTRMVTDTFLNTPMHYDISAEPFGTKFLFDAGALYITDGTSAGTTQLVAGSPTQITVVGSTAYFVHDNAVAGDTELWKTDGTVAGTVLVKDIYPGGTGSFPTSLYNMNGTLYFSAAEPTSGVQLWKSDGTAAGTVLVKAIFPGATNNSSPGNFAAVGNTLFFTANDGVNGHDIWKSDGTTAGTVRVGHSVTSSNFLPGNLTNVGGALYFTANTNETGLELWKSDGTPAGTSVYRDINPGTAWSNVANLSNINGVLYYTATDGVKGNELWRHDVTTNTAVIEDIYRGTRSSNAHNFVTAGNNVYFVTTHMLNGAIEREELWKCALNGTGKTLLRTVQPALLGNLWGFQSLTSFKGDLYFSAFESTIGTELWKSDGTVAGTVRLKDINPNGESWPSSLTVAGDTLYFSAFDGNGAELWKTDGTTAGTVMVRDIAPGNANAIDMTAPAPKFTAIGSTLYFVANDGVNGFELWKTDGTTAGTSMVKDVNPGTASAMPHALGQGFPVQMISIGNLVYFVADDGTNGFELWQSDGTAAGTSIVADLQAGSASSYIQSLTNANGKLYFEYGAIPHGSPLGRVLACRTTATSPLTTIPLLDQGHFRNGTSESLTALGSDVYFTDYDSELGTELWKSDGTVAGTVMVKDIFAYPKSTLNAQTYSSDPKQIVATNGMVYFSAYTPANGRELWMSDGTAAGTTLLADLTGDPGSSSPDSLMAFSGRVYMSAVTEATGREPITVIDVFTPAAPSVLTPSGTTQAQRPSFTWTASAGAISYDIFIKNNATGANPQVSINVPGTSWLPTADLGIGKFTVWVRAVSASGTKSVWSAQKDFTVNTPASPATMMRNQSTSRPKVNWNDVTGAVKYDVWLDSTTAGQVGTVILHDVRGKSWQSATDLALGSYRVWVRGLDASGLAAAWSPVVFFNVGTSPVMTAPLSSTFEHRPQFTWNAVPSATKYDIYIRNMDTETVAFSQANIAATNWTPPSDLPDGHYRWQVVAASANARGLWSNLVDFTIGGQPEILTPTGSTTNTKPPITWKAVSGAATYQVWVDRADTWVQGVINVSGITGTSFTPTNALAAGTYRVWVRAISSTGAFSAWSDFQTFQIT